MQFRFLVVSTIVLVYLGWQLNLPAWAKTVSLGPQPLATLTIVSGEKDLPLFDVWVNKALQGNAPNDSIVIRNIPAPFCDIVLVVNGPNPEVLFQRLYIKEGSNWQFKIQHKAVEGPLQLVFVAEKTISRGRVRGRAGLAPPPNRAATIYQPLLKNTTTNTSNDKTTGNPVIKAPTTPEEATRLVRQLRTAPKQPLEIANSNNCQNPFSEKEMAIFLEELSKKTFDFERMDFMRNNITRHCFTANQLLLCLPSLKFERNITELLKFAYPFIKDVNIASIHKQTQFAFSSSLQDWDKFITNYHTFFKE